MWVIEAIVEALVRIIIQAGLYADGWLLGAPTGQRWHPNYSRNVGRPRYPGSDRYRRHRQLR